jgi:hypothetical protein
VQETVATIPIHVELGSWAAALVDDHRMVQAMRRLEDETTRLLAELGLTGRTAVAVEAVQRARVVGVRVHGKAYPIDRKLLGRVWSAIAPESLPDRLHPDRALPDGWLADLMTHGWDFSLAIELVRCLVLAAIRVRPACLAGSAQASAFASAAAPQGGAQALGSEDWHLLLRGLLDLGVSVADRSLVADAVSADGDAGRPVDDLVEAAFARLVGRTIELHVNPAATAKIALAEETTVAVPVLGRDGPLGEAFEPVVDRLFSDLGIIVPDVLLVPSPEIPLGGVVTRINHCSNPLFLGPQLDEVLALTSPSVLATSDVAARRARDPLSDQPAVIVSDSNRALLEASGFTYLTPLEFAARCLEADARAFADRLLSVTEVEYMLGAMAYTFPELARIALEQCSVEGIARVLRGMLREQCSIRNLRAVLERLVSFETVPVEPSEHVVLDDRVPVPEQVAAHTDADNWRNRLQYIRNGMSDYLRQRYGLDSVPLAVCRTGPQLTAWAEQTAWSKAAEGPEAALSDVDWEALLKMVWARLAEADTKGCRLIILTSSSARRVVWSLLATEFPTLPVLADSEFQLDADVLRLASVELESQP